MADSTHPEGWVPSDTFGARLMLLRADLGNITVEAASKRCGLATATWATWERGANPRNMAVIVEQIHVATGVDRAWLMWGGPLLRTGSNCDRDDRGDTSGQQFGGQRERLAHAS